MPGILRDAVAFEDGFIVAGQADPGIADSDAAAWRSEGLGGWRRIAAEDPALNGDDEAEFSRLVPFTSGLFAIGGSGSREDRLKCEQLLEGAPMAGPGDTALSCGWNREMNWRSDGQRWQRVDPWGPDGEYPPELIGPPPGRAQADWAHVVAGGPGLVALQYELVGEGDDDAADLGLWASPDGINWARVGDGPVLAGEAVVGVLVDGRRVFVMTETGHAWIGTGRALAAFLEGDRRIGDRRSPSSPSHPSTPRRSSDSARSGTPWTTDVIGVRRGLDTADARP